MKKIAVLTGTRAEYGLLKPVLRQIEADGGLALRLIVTGAHLERQFGETVREIEQDGFPIHYKVHMNLTSDKTEGILHSMALELNGLAEIFAKETFDLLILLGDRYELMMAAACAVMNRVPIAHIHGGELTQGAVDDCFRHSVTKMAAIHFTSTERYRRRVIQMGEQPGRVFSVGALGVSNIRKMQFLSQAALSERFGISWERPVILVTYHPVTLEGGTAVEQAERLLSVLSVHSEYNYVFTYANADMDGQAINRQIDRFVSERGNCRAFASMGQAGYLSMLHYAAAVVGNSSSGIIEAPSFHIPTVNIGNRQKGRVRAESVIDCGTGQEEIERAFCLALSDAFRETCRSVSNPYEGKGTAEEIVRRCKEYLSGFENTEKVFYDLKEEIE